MYGSMSHKIVMYDSLKEDAYNDPKLWLLWNIINKRNTDYGTYYVNDKNVALTR